MSAPVPGVDKPDDRSALMALRLVTMMVLFVAITVHMRSLRVFRWEQSVTGGVLITFCLSQLGLALCAGNPNCGGRVLQSYLCCAGATILSVNAAVIWHHWDRASELTQVVAELLTVMGVPLKRQVMLKVILSAVAAAGMMVDLAFEPLIFGIKNDN